MNQSRSPVATTAVLFLLLLFRLPTSGQSYCDYQQTINRIDADVLAEQLPLAIQRFDSLYRSYDFIYAKHGIKALQVSCLLHDTPRMDRWLATCFRQGVPLWMIRNNALTAPALDATPATLLLYDSLRAVYHRSLRPDIARTIDSLVVIDQWYTDRVNNGFFPLRHTFYGLQWLRNNRKQFTLLNDIIQQYGFPGERLIGLPPIYQDSALGFSKVQFYGPSINDIRAYVMLIHYYSHPHPGIHNVLLASMRTGFLPPYQYAGLHDFMARYGKKSKAVYYNVWHEDPDSTHLAAIELRRAQIGLPTLKEQQRNREYQKQRRIHKTGNTTIILE